MILKGFSIEKGIAMGYALIIHETNFKINDNKIENVENEFIFYKKVINKYILYIENLIKNCKKYSNNFNKNNEEIIKVHIEIAKDPEIQKEIKKLILEKKVNLAYAFNNIMTKYENIFKNLENQYIKQKYQDIKEVKEKILKIIFNINLDFDFNIEKDKNLIIVSNELLPCQIFNLNAKNIKGIITNLGSITSHSAIIAKNLEIPMISGIQNCFNKIKENDFLIIDANTGQIFINPNYEIKEKFELQIKNENNKLKYLNKFKNAKSFTKDGKKILVSMNIKNINDISLIEKYNPDSIGLFRSEFIYLEANNWPTEDEQFNIYKKILESFKEKEITIRTLDIGGDKNLNYYTFEKELNPFLGTRGIRFTFEKEEIFKTQLRALIKASNYGKLAIMFPMISTIEEFLKAKKIYESVYDELFSLNEKIPDKSKIKIGMMIETPSSAMISDLFGKYSDFFSIGTNDLIQYSMAADRTNQKVLYLYQPLNSSIVRMLDLISKGAKKNNIEISICGEMSSYLKNIPILIGLDIDKISTSGNKIFKIREIVSKISYIDSKQLVQKCLNYESEIDVINEIEIFWQKYKL